MTKQGITHGMIEVEYPKTKFPDGEEISNNLFFLMAFMEVKKPQKPNPEPEPDPIPVPTPDTLPDIAEDSERAHDEDQSEDKQPEEKKQTTRTVVTKTSVVKKTVTKPVTQ